MSRTASRILALLALALAALAYAPILGFEPPVVEAEGPVESFFFQPADTSPQLVYGMAALFFLGRRRWMRAALDAGEHSAEHEDDRRWGKRYDFDWNGLSDLGRFGRGLLVQVDDGRDKVLVWLD